ncbi:2-dehydropantoate 2-reductase [Bifidobacterium lemurum]|uniref:2-dehydropantoate 2-reductase n=1 Tax=Bifidobacterium lemurum TaxID=1603886 RepID=A0A261FLB2_9BIFI|nr:ketopantoate reductase family protein [Bifidobacterium lemurum]OZG59927.1 2-dehydropantoate 2-reductase [Bifidobacterium lemurum]QOL33949.1 ketopantoate reductase family protein [Bifidobacterium lemurum]
MAIRTVSIIGLGAEGSVAYYAARRSLGADRVRVIATGERAERLKRDGMVINGESYELNVVAPGEGRIAPDLLIVAVKSYQLQGILDDIAREIDDHTTLMSLINGLSSEETLARRFGAEHVVYSMSKINAKKSGNHVDFKPVGQIAIGEKDGSVSGRVKDAHALFAAAVPCAISDDIYLEIWRKYMLNAACNTVEAIFRGRHRWFQRIPEARDAMECVMREIVALAEAMGVGLTQRDIRDLDGFFDDYDPDGMRSMVQDVLHGNQTEIDMFMGEALRMGREYGVDLPVCRFVYDIITSIDKANAGALDA